MNNDPSRPWLSDDYWRERDRHFADLSRIDQEKRQQQRIGDELWRELKLGKPWWDLIPVESKRPHSGQYIFGLSEADRLHSGRAYIEGDVVGVEVDFWSGTAGERITHWAPRTPSGKPGHPWTSIERGCA